MTDRLSRLRLLVIGALLAVAVPLHTEDGSQGWLRYAPPDFHGIPASYEKLPGALVNLNTSAKAVSAQKELRQGVQSMLDRILRVETKIPINADAWVLGTTAELRSALPEYHTPAPGSEGFSSPGRRPPAARRMCVVSPAAV